MNRNAGKESQATVRPAEIVREYGFPGVDKIAGVTHDGRRVWAATGAKLVAFDPGSVEDARNEHFGLLLVDELADRWGLSLDGMTAVWLEVDAPQTSDVAIRKE